MSFRRRLALSCAGAVAFAVVLGSVRRSSARSRAFSSFSANGLTR